MMQSITIRRAVREDCPALLALVRDLAAFERAAHEVTVTLEHFTESGFGPHPVWWAFVAEAEAVALDANGRFLISKRMLKAAGIDRSVRFVGMDDTVEIWNGEPSGAPFMGQEDFAKAVQAIMAGDAGAPHDAPGKNND